MTRDGKLKQNVPDFFRLPTVHLPLPYSLLWKKADLGRLTGAHRFLDDLISKRHCGREENKVRVFITSASSLQGDHGLVLCLI